eukprot:3534978-Prymnesium_polylepis.1
MLKAWEILLKCCDSRVTCVPKLFVAMAINYSEYGGASLCSKLLDERGVTLRGLVLTFTHRPRVPR